MSRAGAGSSWFQRFLLPGLAFKGVVIGGGYATGRELAEFFVPSGPQGGLAAMLLAMAIWSAVCAATFAFAHMTRSFDYRSFFHRLLGPGWIAFEIVYLLLLVLILAVIGAAAGEIGASFGAPPILGTLLLGAVIAAITSFGSASVERLFKYASILLYLVYALFLLLGLTSFGDRIAASLATPAAWDGWVAGGVTYAGYNLVAAAVVLPLTRHLTSRRDALIAGAVAGPLAMLPALGFFLCMIAFYPGIGAETLPSSFLLAQMEMPAFRIAFQAMIFAALLETGVGVVHAVNERVAGAWHARRGSDLSQRARAGIALGLLIGCIFVANRFGLVALIGSGYRLLGFAVLAVFVLPLLTIGVARMLRTRPPVLNGETAS
ncbi:hypothetical protein ACMGDH_01785 [Sphingomonas sp. DT-207]|uniref:YkvI family membrane protein n=1 Tax=Sphingomonas sp. DT-207 TaxID=3396167 RepID=UPI003F1DE842